MASNGGSRIIASSGPTTLLERNAGKAVSLKYVISIAVAGLVTMSLALAYALVAGDFRTDALELMENPWGLATLVDAYVGFALFSCWVLWREPLLSRALLWVVLILAGGNLVSALYVLNALRVSKGNVAEFWLGSRRQSVSAAARWEPPAHRS